MTQQTNHWQISDVLQSTGNLKKFLVYESARKFEILSEENDLRTLVDTEDFKFHLVYQGSKMMGYSFEFSKEPCYTNERTALFMFDEHKSEPKVDVLYEDQIVRLLQYNQTDSKKSGGKIKELQRKPDYWLVCRWRY